jgi:2OG-Fe(II) oxygenase superfamily
MSNNTDSATQMDSNIHILENYISEEDADLFLSYIKENYLDRDKFPMTRGERDYGRLRHEANIPETVPLSQHMTQIELIKKYSEKVINTFKDLYGDEELYISAFWMTMLGKDTRLPYHVDNHVGAEHLFRSAVIYLNEDYDGGSIQFERNNFLYQPVKYSAIFFPSKYSHRINIVSDGIRFALPIWASVEEKFDIFKENDNG